LAAEYTRYGCSVYSSGFSTLLVFGGSFSPGAIAGGVALVMGIGGTISSSVDHFVRSAAGTTVAGSCNRDESTECSPATVGVSLVTHVASFAG
jgi:hypothetical protein